MDNIDAISAEKHYYATQNVKHEVTELIWDMDSKFKSLIVAKCEQLPILEIKKQDLGKTDFNTEFEKNKPLEIKMVLSESEKDDPDNLRILITDKGRLERETPEIQEQVVNNEQLKQIESLPRTYRGVGEGETGIVYKDKDGKPVGWVSIVENQRDKNAFIAFIGVSVHSEQNSYGTAIIKSLQSKYRHLALTMLPYDTAGRGYDEASSRLKRFYIRNGFYMTNGGQFAWNNSEANIEKSGQVMVKDVLIAQGERYSDNRILETYFTRVLESESSAEIFDDKEQRLIKSWLELRKEQRQLDNEADHYDRIITNAEYNQRTETAGL